jgi:hypothetical protein
MIKSSPGVLISSITCNLTNLEVFEHLSQHYVVASSNNMSDKGGILATIMIKLNLIDKKIVQ